MSKLEKKIAKTKARLRGCLKSPDSRQILSSMCLLQLPESWHEACTTSVNCKRHTIRT